MERAAEGTDQHTNAGGSIALSAAFEDTEPIGRPRGQARSFLAELRTVHRLPVSDRAADQVELVVSELVTNSRKYAPGPCLLTLVLREDCVEVSVWDGNPVLPSVLPPDPYRVGQHGLEIVMAAAQAFRVEREGVGKRVTAAIALVDP